MTESGGRATWERAEFHIAMPGGPHLVRGYIYRGLGLHLGIPGSPKGRRPAKWVLTHLGSGHSVAYIDGPDASVLPVAAEVAEAGEWSFDHLEGWKNHFPDAREKVDEILARHRRGGRTSGGGASEEIARAIAVARGA